MTPARDRRPESPQDRTPDAGPPDAGPPHARLDDADAPARRQCGAKTRSGVPCKTPPVNGKRRCRMHGGAPGSGAPRGNQNAVKFGYHRKEARDLRKEGREFLRYAEQVIREMERPSSWKR